MSDTANAREIIETTLKRCGCEDDTMGAGWGADQIIAALAANGLEIRPIAPPAGKDVGEDELALTLAKASWERSGLAWADCPDPSFWINDAHAALAAIRVPLIRQGMREAADTHRKNFGNNNVTAWLEFYADRARADAMGKGEE